MELNGKNHYETLSVAEKASESEITTAYQELKASLSETATTPASESRLEAIEEAYQILQDSQSRYEYDKQLAKQRKVEHEREEVLVYLRENMGDEDKDTRVIKRPVLNLFGNLENEAVGIGRIYFSKQLISVGLLTLLVLAMGVVSWMHFLEQPSLKATASKAAKAPQKITPPQTTETENLLLTKNEKQQPSKVNDLSPEKSEPEAEKKVEEEVVGKEVSKFSELTQNITLGDVETVLSLLKAGRNPNELDDNGVSPLALSIRLRQIEMVRLLIAAGADPNLPDNNGTFPYEHAQKVGDKEILKILKEKMSRI